MENLIGQDLLFEDEQGETISFPIIHSFEHEGQLFVFVSGVDDDDIEIVIPFRVEIDDEGILDAFDIEDADWEGIEKAWLQFDNEQIEDEE